VSYLVQKKRPTGSRQAVNYNTLSEAQKRVMEADLLNKFRGIQKKVSYLPIPTIEPGVDLNELVDVYKVYRRAPMMIENADFYKGVLQKIWVGFQAVSGALDLGKPVEGYFGSLLKSIDRHDLMFREMSEVSLGEAGPVDPWKSFYKLTGYSIVGGLVIILANKFIGNPLVNGYVKKTIDEFLNGIAHLNSTGGPVLNSAQQAQPQSKKKDNAAARARSAAATGGTRGKRERPRPTD